MPDFGVDLDPKPIVAVEQDANGGAKINAAVLFGGAPKWCDPGAPDGAAAFLNANPGAFTAWPIRHACGFFETPGKVATLPAWAVSMFGKKPSWWGPLWFVHIAYFIAAMLDGVLTIAVSKFCDRKDAAGLMLRKLAWQPVQHWLLGGPPTAADHTQYTIDFACPTVIAAPEVFIQAWLHEEMSDGDAKGWCKAHGWCEYATYLTASQMAYHYSVGDIIGSWHKNVIDEMSLDSELNAAGVKIEARRRRITDSARYRHPAAIVVDLYYRQVIQDSPTAEKRLQEAGITDARERDELLHERETLWGVSEIYRALHMLRPGRVSGDIEYTEEQAAKDLRALGYSHARIPQMLYLARTELGLRQLLQPYYQGYLDDGSLIELVKDDGFADDDLRRLAPFWRFLRAQKFAADAGAPTSKEIVASLAAGTSSMADYQGEMRDLAYPPAVIQAGVKEAIDSRTRSIRAAGIAAVQAGLKAGEMDEAGAVAALSASGVGSDEAAVIVREWLVRMETSSKPAGVSTLCQWFGLGWISYGDYEQRLLRMGYSRGDIKRMVDACELADRRAKDKTTAANARARLNAIRNELVDIATVAARIKSVEGIYGKPADKGTLGALPAAQAKQLVGSKLLTPEELAADQQWSHPAPPPPPPDSGAPSDSGETAPDESGTP